jgi:GNAT superfamily N-acetyltransferase
MNRDALDVSIRLKAIVELPEDFARLVELSLREDFLALQRMRENWNAGLNRFNAPGEVLFGARVGSRLIGICGLNRDPYAKSSGIGRVRHLYVDPEYRRHGVGRALVAQVIECAKCSFSHLRLRTLRADADMFYVALGFLRMPGAKDVTHELEMSASHVM